MENFVVHNFEPVFDKNTKILILGTMPSPKSREAGFYYSHPQNRFWKILSELFREPVPTTNIDKKALLIEKRIGLWDVLKSCNIMGADDNSIKNTVPNDLSYVLNRTNISAIFTTGKKAYGLYKKYFSDTISIPCFSLPSTSPANCRFYQFDDLVKEYSIILNYLK